MPPTDTESPPRVALLRRLIELEPGERGRLHAESISPEERDMLAALGLVDRSTLRLCKGGSPWIVQVRGTRIGLADGVARRLMVSADVD